MALRYLVCISLLLWQLSSTYAQSVDDRYQATIYPRADREATVLIFSDRELVERGVQNVADALEKIPEVQVRLGGRGDTRVELRGAKQRSILVLIDGMPIDEPYFGGFDLASIPVTDIVSIRVVLSPASPLEGPGGDGGLVEVKTRRATGTTNVIGDLQGSTLPGVRIGLSARTPLSQHWALRTSWGGYYSLPEYPAVLTSRQPIPFRSDGGQSYSGLRLEYVASSWQFTTDVFFQHRQFYVPPGEETGADLSYVRGDDNFRIIAGFSGRRRKFHWAAGTYFQGLKRETAYYEDASVSVNTLTENVRTFRAGTALLLDTHWTRQSLRAGLIGRASYDHEGSAIDSSARPAQATGHQGLLETALGTTVAWRTFDLAVAFGLALPVRRPEHTWLEAKATLRWRPNAMISIWAIGARKGRVPTLRESFSPTDGNADLSPEQTSYAELVVQANPTIWLSGRLSGYSRTTNGLIRLDPVSFAQVINLDTMTVRGFDAALQLFENRLLSGGCRYMFADTASPTLGLDPIDNFAKHRVDGWLAFRWRQTVGAVFRARYIGSRRDKSFVLPDYAVLDVSAWWRLAKNISINARVDNLTNANYAVRAGFYSLPTIFFAGMQVTM